MTDVAIAAQKRRLRLGFCHDPDMDPESSTVQVDLWRADAVVLFDWLMSVDLDTVPISHPAQKQALMDLLTRFETENGLPGLTQVEIDEAQLAVAQDMGW